MTLLLAVPNVSEGRDSAAVAAIGRSFEQSGFGTRLLGTHSDPDHHRSVFTLAGPPGGLARAVLAGARAALATIDLAHHQGIHPRVGVLDVAPIVYRDPADRGAACAEALVLADLLAEELALPVFLYGELTEHRVTRAQLRRGGPAGLSARLAAGESRPDFGPAELHPTAGAVLVAARPPLVAFNIELAAPASEADARRVAAAIREGGSAGLPAVRAIGLWLAHRELAQVSVNLEDHTRTTLAEIVHAIAAQGVRPAAAELVGLAPAAAFDCFPPELPVSNRRFLEDAV